MTDSVSSTTAAGRVSSAIVLDEPGKHRIEARPAPAPGPGEALVAVAAVGICGSDRDVYRGTRPRGYVRYPVTPGHEWSGTVASVGPGADPALVGRKVVGENFRPCRVCDHCRSGEGNLCTAFGYDEIGFTRPGACADTLLLPADALHVLADDADLRSAALLEPAAVAAAAALKARPAPGISVAVVGAGTLGLLVTQLLAACSPAELVVVDPRGDREELAGRCGATAWCDPGEVATRKGRFDLVVESAGVSGTARDAVALARRGGDVVLTGIPAPGARGLDPAELVVRQVTLHTVFGAGTAAWRHAVRAFTVGLLTPAPLITHDLPVEEYADALELLESGQRHLGKVLLHP